MNASRRNTDHSERDGCQYALRRGLGTWEITYEGRRNSFRDEQGAEYVVWLLLRARPTAASLMSRRRELSGGFSLEFSVWSLTVIWLGRNGLIPRTLVTPAGRAGKKYKPAGGVCTGLELASCSGGLASSL